MNKQRWLIIAAMLMTPLVGLMAATVENLRCEYREKPLGIDVVQPRLSWVIRERIQNSESRIQNSGDRGLKQTAYRVLVASSEELLKKDQGDLWDSGKVESDKSIQVEYVGKRLESRMQCFWKVRVWTCSALNPSVWSAPAFWTMGLIDARDPSSPGYAEAGWTAKWIGNDAAYQSTPESAADDKLFNLKGLKWVQMSGKDRQKSVDTYLRRQFDLPSDRTLKRAILVLYAFNECEASVNCVAVGSAAHWEATSRLDVSKAMKSGTNVIGLIVRHTDPHLPAAIGRLVLQFEAGRIL